MNSTILYTPSQILEERQNERSRGKLAHTPNGRGEFYARIECGCYNCRDVLDPTGELDAKARNDAMNVPPLPAQQPKLVRQYAICLECGGQHSCSDPCRPPHLSLPPPPRAVRQCNYCRSPTEGLSISPIVGVLSPRSVSSGSKPIYETCQELEVGLERQIRKLLKKYRQLEAHIESEREKPGTKLDEMAAYDAWAEEVARKEDALQEFLDLLKE